MALVAATVHVGTCIRPKLMRLARSGSSEVRIGLSQARLSRELFQSFNGADIRSIRHYDPANDGEFIEES